AAPTLTPSPSCFFFNDTAPPEISTLSLHDALPILAEAYAAGVTAYIEHALASRLLPIEFRLLGYEPEPWTPVDTLLLARLMAFRSEEHTSELQSRENLVCRLLLEKKKNDEYDQTIT